jgi:phage terminase small subunit
MSESTSKLTPKQELFVREYLVDFNATQAAIRAGYSKDTARQIGSENLSKLYIQQAITDLVNSNNVKEKIEVTVERVLEEYSRLAFLDIREAFDDNGNLLPISAMPEDVARAINGFDTSVWKENGDDGGVETTKKVKFIDKRGALQDLGKYLKMFIDRVEHTGKDGEALFPEITESEFARRAAFLLMGEECQKH